MRFLSAVNEKEISGKTCILRVDFNVEDAKDSLRLEASLPTMRLLLKNKAKILIISHRGRPKLVASSKQQVARDLSLKTLVPFLKKNLGQKVKFFSDISDVSQRVGTVGLLENLRFWPGEESNDPDFAGQLAKLGDFYVNDAFAVSHRENASVTELPKLLPSYAGLLLEKEIETLSKAMENPEEPLVLIMGGSKVEDKLPIIKHLLPKADRILLGSAALNQPELIPKSEKIITPVDSIDGGGKAWDIGPETIKKYSEEIKKAKTIIWNGPLGQFEDEKYAKGSMEIAKAIAASKAFSIVGGGETNQLILSLKLQNKIGFLSTGGGAMLEFLAGKKLPGIEALK